VGPRPPLLPESSQANPPRLRQSDSISQADADSSAIMLSHSAAWKKHLSRSLHRHVPITQWLPEYNREKFICDLIAGVTVGLTIMPQALAYAALAGVEPQVSCYSPHL